MTVVSGVTLNFVDCASVLAFLVKKNISNGQFIIQGQFQIHFHSSLINNFKKSKKYEPSQYISSHNAWYEPEHQLSFEVIGNFSTVYVSVKIWKLEECM